MFDNNLIFKYFNMNKKKLFKVLKITHLRANYSKFIVNLFFFVVCILVLNTTIFL